MLEFPLFYVVFHGYGENGIPQEIAQIVEHGCCFVVYISISAAMSYGLMKLIAMGIEAFIIAINGIIQIRANGS